MSFGRNLILIIILENKSIVLCSYFHFRCIYENYKIISLSNEVKIIILDAYDKQQYDCPSFEIILL